MRWVVWQLLKAPTPTSGMVSSFLIHHWTVPDVSVRIIFGAVPVMYLYFSKWFGRNSWILKYIQQVLFHAYGLVALPASPYVLMPSSTCASILVLWHDDVELYLTAESRSTSSRHGEAKSESKSHHRSAPSQSGNHRDHRDELASSSGSLAKQVDIVPMSDGMCPTACMSCSLSMCWASFSLLCWHFQCKPGLAVSTQFLFCISALVWYKCTGLMSKFCCM